MFNSSNFGIYTGRVSAPAKFFPCNGGSIMMLTVACRRTYGDKASDFISFRQFIPDESDWYSGLSVGDKVTITYQLQSGSRELEDGTKQYYQNCYVIHLEYCESRAVRDARHKAGGRKKSK